MQKVLPIILFILLVATVNAQGVLRDRVESQRVAFITQKLELTPDESAAFWPIYNAFRDKQEDLKRSLERWSPDDMMSDPEALERIENRFQVEEDLIALKRSYYEKMQAVIPPAKLVRLAPAEQAFNREMLAKIRQWRNRRK